MYRDQAVASADVRACPTLCHNRHRPKVASALDTFRVLLTATYVRANVIPLWYCLAIFRFVIRYSCQPASKLGPRTGVSRRSCPGRQIQMDQRPSIWFNGNRPKAP